MQMRRLGKTNRIVSEIGFGAWAIGGGWGETEDTESLAAMHAAVDAGVEGATFAQLALRWILGFEAVSTVIPGSADPDHVAANAGASSAPDLAPEVRRRLKELWLGRRIHGTFNGSG